MHSATAAIKAETSLRLQRVNAEQCRALDAAVLVALRYSKCDVCARDRNQFRVTGACVGAKRQMFNTDFNGF